MQSVPSDSAGASELTREGLRQAIVVDTEKVRGHLDEVVRSTVETTLNQLLDEEADRIAGAGKYERSTERKSSLLVAQQDRLLNLRPGDAVDQHTFAKKHSELRDRLSSIKPQLDVLDRFHDETAELAAEVFELSQTLQNTWLSADGATKRRMLEILCLNCTLDGVSAVFTMRKPFDVLIEGLDLSKSRGDSTPIELFLEGVRAWESKIRVLLSLSP